MSSADSSVSVEYRPIPNFPGYRASSGGWIESCLMKGPGSRFGDTWKRLIGSSGRYGYQLVGLYRVGQSRSTQRVNRLVCEAFHGPCPDGMQCCHNDGNKRNNTYTNLRWDTPSANQRDRIKHGTDMRGESHPMSKLTDGIVREIRAAFASGMPQRAIARKFNTNRVNVRHIVHRLTWRHVE